MDLKNTYCKLILIMSFVVLMASCALSLTEGESWLTLNKGKSEMDISGLWNSPEWGLGKFKQENGDITGILGDYKVKGVVNGNEIFLIMYSGEKVDYTAKLNPSDGKNFKGFYRKYEFIDENSAKKAKSDEPTLIRPITLNRLEE